MKSIAMVALCALALPAAAQIYKCPDGSGRTVIQQTPCTGGGGQKMTVRPASGHAAAPRPSAPASAASAAKPMTEAQRLNAQSDASAKERRRRDLERRIVPNARADMYGHRDQCQRTLARLRDEQYRYVQNLYGKTHASQIASEMASTSAQCDTKDRELTAFFQQVLNECRGMGGCQKIEP